MIKAILKFDHFPFYRREKHPSCRYQVTDVDRHRLTKLYQGNKT
jgi:hypothetical protein